MAVTLPEKSQRGSDAVFAGNQMLNILDMSDSSTWGPALEVAQEFLSKPNPETSHSLTAVGHCHIGFFLLIYLFPFFLKKKH